MGRKPYQLGSCYHLSQQTQELSKALLADTYTNFLLCCCTPCILCFVLLQVRPIIRTGNWTIPYNRMFYVSKNIETEVFFTHHDMHKTCSDPEVLRRLRQKVEGYCDNEYGYIIQVIAANNNAERALQTNQVDIRQDGLYARVKFSCITYRPNKNEIMPVVVTEVTEDSIVGKVGPAIVMIPQMKLLAQSVHFRPHEGAYEVRGSDEESRTIKRGSVILCRCFEVRVEMNSIMKIIGNLDAELLQLLFLRDPEEQE